MDGRSGGVPPIVLSLPSCATDTPPPAPRRTSYPAHMLHPPVPVSGALFPPWSRLAFEQGRCRGTVTPLLHGGARNAAGGADLACCRHPAVMCREIQHPLQLTGRTHRVRMSTRSRCRARRDVRNDADAMCPGPPDRGAPRRARRHDTSGRPGR